jgi:acyl-CoA reductase-like NAD-dependent aldehyde dehydrogenase
LREEQAIVNQKPSVPMARDKKDQAPKVDLEAEALSALEAAREMKPGAERTEAMKRAGILRNAADLQRLFFAKRGRPAKT